MAEQEKLIADLAELADFAASLAGSLSPGQVYLLTGDLGVGKTTLVREVCRCLGGDAERVVSPSYTLVQEYEDGRIPIVHIDLYRVDPGQSLDSLFLEELLERGDSVAFIEWPGVAEPMLPAGTKEIRLEFGPAPTMRKIVTHVES